jgi:hypothetical protein
LTTLLQFETSVSNETGLSLNISAEKQTVDDAINVGVQRVLEDTHCYVISAALTGFDGTSADFSIDASILEVVELWFTSGGTSYPLEHLSVADLVRRRLYSSSSSTPLYYAVGGANLLMFYPTPPVGATLNVYYVPIPTALSSPTDDPADTTHGGVPQILHEAIFYHACRRVASYDDDQSSAQGQRYSDWYDKEMERYRGIIRKRGGARNARAVVNDKRRLGRYHDNSVYPRY